MAEDNFEKIYKMLGVGPTDSWDTIQKAYRRRAQDYHPDRVADNPRLKKIAGRRFHELNQHFSELRRYYRNFGGVPPVLSNKEEHHPEKMRAKSPSPSVTSGPTEAKKPQPTTSRRTKLAAIAGALAIVCVIFWQILFSQNSGEGNSVLSQSPLPSVPPPVAVGWTMGEVIERMGSPDRVIDDSWFYGDFVVDLDSGRVVAVTRADNLGARSTAAQKPPAILSFGFDSSMEEVIKIQGQPIKKTQSDWQYRVSKVYFENGRVVGWYNSHLDPLRVDGQFGSYLPLLGSESEVSGEEN